MIGYLTEMTTAMEPEKDLCFDSRGGLKALEQALALRLLGSVADYDQGEVAYQKLRELEEEAIDGFDVGFAQDQGRLLKLSILDPQYSLGVRRLKQTALSLHQYINFMKDECQEDKPIGQLCAEPRLLESLEGFAHCYKELADSLERRAELISAYIH